MTQVTHHRHHTVAFILTAIALAASLSSSAHAAPTPWGRHFRGLSRSLASLNLTEEQRTAIRDIVRSERSAFRSAMERVREARAELQKAVGADPVDESLIRQKVEDLAQVGAEAAILRARVGARIRALLTEEQKEKAAELRERRTLRARARSAAVKAYFDAMTEQ